MIQHADVAQGDNGSIEANNAQLRRRAKVATQQKKLDLADLSTFFVLGESKAESLLLYGQGPPQVEAGTSGAPAASGPSAEPPKMAGGGGGLCRKYISTFCHLYKDESGQVDITAATAAYRHAQTDPDQAEVLASLADDARRGTLAVREAFQKFGRKSVAPLSAFGRVKRNQGEIAKLANETRLVLTDLERAAEARSTVAASPLDVLAIRDAHRSVQAVVATIPGDLETVQRILRRTARMHACDVAKQARQRDAELRDVIVAATPSGIDMSSANLLKSGQLRTLPSGDCIGGIGSVSDLVWVDHNVDVAADVVAHLRNRKKSKDGKATGKALLGAYDRFHKLIRHDQQPKIVLSQNCRPRFCYQHGMGHCLCTGDGILLRLIKRNFASALCRLCPAKTSLRSWLMDGWLVALLIEDAVYAHISLMYLRPQRPTVLRLSDHGKSKWGLTQLDVQCEGGTGFLDVCTVCDFFSDLCLDDPKSLRLFKLASLDRTVHNFTPAENVLVRQIEERYLTRLGDGLQFWAGARTELERQAEKDREAAEAAARRRARQAAGEPRQKRRRRPVLGRLQRGVMKRPASSLVPASPSEAIAPSEDGQGGSGDEAGFWNGLSEKASGDSEAEMFEDFHGCFGESEKHNAAKHDMDLFDLFASDPDPDPLVDVVGVDEGGEAVLFSPTTEEDPFPVPPAPGTPTPPATSSPSHYSPTSPEIARSSLGVASGSSTSGSSFWDGPSVHSSDLEGIPTPRSSELGLDRDSDSADASESCDSREKGKRQRRSHPVDDTEPRLLCRFGPFKLKRLVVEGGEYVGVRLECFQHRHDDRPAGSKALPCQRGIHFGKALGKESLSESECVLRCKRWGLWGCTIASTDPRGRSEHHRKAPRFFNAPLEKSIWDTVPMHLFADEALDGI